MRDQGDNQVDIGKMIEQEFIKKIEDVYTKQILLYETNQAHNQTFTSISSNNE